MSSAGPGKGQEIGHVPFQAVSTVDADDDALQNTFTEPERDFGVRISDCKLPAAAGAFDEAAVEQGFGERRVGDFHIGHDAPLTAGCRGGLACRATSDDRAVEQPGDALQVAPCCGHHKVAAPAGRAFHVEAAHVL